jgi:catechol 2,3-dioxygenase-like lactoylglutathione lyase family enzyme
VVTAAPPFAILGLDHLVLHVRGMAEAERFYCEVLGCTVAHRMPQHAMTELSAGSSTVVLVDTTDPNGGWALEGTQPGRNVDHFALAAGPWDEAAMRHWLAAQGIEIEEERADGDELSFYVRDPSGNLVELLRRG